MSTKQLTKIYHIRDFYQKRDLVFRCETEREFTSSFRIDGRQDRHLSLQINICQNKMVVAIYSVVK